MYSKLLNYALAFFLILTLNFLLPRMMPGDPLMAIHGGEMLVELTPEREAALRERYALDQPLPQQFANYLGRLAAGDLGQSYYYAVPVSELIRGAVPWTLLLAGSALVLSSLLGIILGIEAGWRHNRSPDRALVGMAGLLNGFPDFLIGALLLVFFGAGLAWFPVSGALTPYAGLSGWALVADVARHLFLPLTALTLANLAGMFLLIRGAPAATGIVALRAAGPPRSGGFVVVLHSSLPAPLGRLGHDIFPEKGVVRMDFERAREIVESDKTIEVVHSGRPVWIEGLNPENKTARIRPLNGTAEEVIDVSVTQLVEGRTYSQQPDSGTAPSIVPPPTTRSPR